MHNGRQGAFATPRAGSRSLDWLFRSVVLCGILVTSGMLLLGTHGHAAVPVLDLVLDTIAFFACVALTALAWARFRESVATAAIYHASAFMVLATGYGIALVISLVHSSSIADLGEPEGIQSLVFALSRLAAAMLFVVAGTFVTRASYGRQPVRILVLPTLLVVGAALAGAILGPPPPALEILHLDQHEGLPHITAFGAAVHLSVASLFFAGAYASRRLWRSGQSVIDAYIAVGLIFAGFGELIWTMFPSAHPGQVSIGDIFRLAFSVTLLVGLEAAVRAGLHDLRTANASLNDLRDADVQRAALEERTRLARELHDGLSQDLWLAKLRTGEVLAVPDLPPAARASALAAASAVDAGLGEARQAVAALRSVGTGEPTFPELVRRTVDESADRYGLRVEFSWDGDERLPVAPRTQAEVLRIVQEALTNVARHAEATMVGVRLAIRPGRLTLRVVDNGRGFDPAGVRDGAFGLVSMRERAALIGGRVRIASRPGDGSRIQVTAPTGSKPGSGHSEGGTP